MKKLNLLIVIVSCFVLPSVVFASPNQLHIAQKAKIDRAEIISLESRLLKTTLNPKIKITQNRYEPSNNLNPVQLSLPGIVLEQALLEYVTNISLDLLFRATFLPLR